MRTYERILVAGKADEADLARLFCRDQRFERSVGGKEAVGILQTNVLVILHQVDDVGLQPLQRLVDLGRRRRLGAAVELGHQEDALPIAVAQRVAHAPLALAVVVVPAVVHEGDAAIDGRADDADAFRPILRHADVEAAEPESGHAFTRLAELTVDHAGSLRRRRWRALIRIGHQPVRPRRHSLHRDLRPSPTR